MQAMTNPQTSQQSWWLLGLRGVLAILFGLVALIWPGETLFVLVVLFGAYILIDGIISVVVAIREHDVFRHWWVLLIEGLVGIAVGLITFFWPAITALVLLFLIAIWAILTGIFEIGAAFSGRAGMGQEWALGIAGVLSVILGILLLIRPGAGLLTIIWLVGIYAIVFGILFIVRAFQHRSLLSAL